MFVLFCEKKSFTLPHRGGLALTSQEEVGWEVVRDKLWRFCLHLPRHGAAVLQPRPLRSDLEATPSIRWMTMKYNYDEASGSVLDEKVNVVVICALHIWNQINITKWNFWSPCLCLQNMIVNELLIISYRSPILIHTLLFSHTLPFTEFAWHVHYNWSEVTLFATFICITRNNARGFFPQ